MSGGTWLTCSAPPGRGGLGQIAGHSLRAAERAGERVDWLAATAVSPQAPLALRRALPAGMRVLRAGVQRSPLRWSRPWATGLDGIAFDRAVAALLPRGERLLAFNGMGLATMRRARRLGYARVELVSATLHVQQVWDAQARARRDSGGDPGWLCRAELARTLAEYAEADLIHVISPLALEGFVARGLPRERLRLLEVEADPRFVPSAAGDRLPGGLRVVFTGDVSALKGAHVLRRAFAAWPDPTARLTLVGGTGSRFMRRFVRDWLRDDPRVRQAPGDPLPVLQTADVYVHPSYSDGLGLAALEALRCRVPVIVSADTGMRHLVQEGRNGWVVPTGDAQALLERLRRAAEAASGPRPAA